MPSGLIRLIFAIAPSRCVLPVYLPRSMTPSATRDRRIGSAFGLHRRVARELREFRLTSHFGAHVGGELLRRVVGRDGHAERLHATAERGGVDGVVEMLVEEGDDRCRRLARRGEA